MRGATARMRAAAVAAAAMLALAGCGGTSEDAGTDASAPPADATVVEVSAVEYGYTATPASVDAGTITFELTNDGGMSHDLVLEEDPGGSTAVIGPGETDAFTVDLEPGTYTLYCSVGNHRALGMEMVLVVE
ncbi:plastocyanin/azurin family copper-binding protein [Demequina sp. SYSU T00192]|uniref:Plastocyanin/azurin family copper-binding protein n=1 Tax=Demequina litoralis TaxID=3051660 RepID=A0ABT8GB75_9MICO|nr:plastocyanin/azurin family copper-binding protein [Demequina sp. SYSU T00192]MDN4476393.1 plastocyanin/azurin family copper-binding protein [Demequina sp. SYSU T00192]